MPIPIVAPAAISAAAGAAGGSSFLAGLGSLGNMAGGLGQLLGGLGFGGGKKRGPSWQDQRKMSRQMIQTNMKATIDAAHDNGISPLVALGMPSASFSTYQPDNGPSFDPAQIGQGIDRALNVGKNGMQRKLDELAIENAELSNDYLRVQMAGAMKALNNTGVPPAVEAGLPGDGEHLNDRLKAWKSDKMGIEDGFAPQHKIMLNQDGHPIRVLNTDVVGDNEILMLMDALMSTIPDMRRGKAKRVLGPRRPEDNTFWDRAIKALRPRKK